MDALPSPANLAELRLAAYGLLRRDPAHRDAHLRLYELEQMNGQPVAALAHLRAALTDSRIVSSPATGNEELGVLAISRIGLWEGNVPLELVLDLKRFALHRLYLDYDDDETVLDRQPLPPCAVAFTTIGESDWAQPHLALAERMVARLGVAVVNAPAAVATMSRDGVARRFDGSANVLAPAVERVPVASLQQRRVSEPLVVRPVGSQAGIGLVRVEHAAELQTYLANRGDAEYFVAPFVDYASPDGFYRKYRIMVVGGVPLPCHLAISPRWMIHYYNAPMAENAWMRDEEGRFLDDLAGVFRARAGEGLREIVAAIPLDYYGFDVAIAPDGRLLLFEADAAMLVHGTDSPALFPYKRAAFERIQAALGDLLVRRATGG